MDDFEVFAGNEETESKNIFWCCKDKSKLGLKGKGKGGGPVVIIIIVAVVVVIIAIVASYFFWRRKKGIKEQQTIKVQEMPAQPAPKKRRSLAGAIVALQGSTVIAQGEEESLIDVKVTAEIEHFEQISCKILAQVHPQGLDAR